MGLNHQYSFNIVLCIFTSCLYIGYRKNKQLFSAVQSGDLATLSSLIKAGENVNSVDNDG
jgi:hypothetical protein